MTELEASRIPPHGDASEPVRLRAGPLTVLLVDGDLRRIRYGEREAIRRLHGAVRDRDWGTVPGRIRDLRIERSAGAFRMAYHREHRLGEIHFEWRAEILGGDDGTIRFEFDGVAKSDFLANRIGLCLLHPIRECVGASCRTLHADGLTVARAFPEQVAAEQPIHGFTDLTGLAHEVAPGIWMEASFEGGLFETEDQRNWIDASFKTYSPPLRHAFPVAIRSGTRIRQAVVLRLRGLHGQVPAGPPVREVREAREAREPEVISVLDTRTVPLPRIGLGLAAGVVSTKTTCGQRLAGLGLSHLRTDIRLARSDWQERLAAALSEAGSLGAGLELAVYLPRDGDAPLDTVARELRQPGVDCHRVLVLREGRPTTLGADLEAAREAFRASGATVGAGTDADLYQIHLQPPPWDGDFLCWSMNPQVHATDDWSLLETPEAAGHQIATLHHRHPGLPLIVSPITLKPRRPPGAATRVESPDGTQQPPAGDRRQNSLLAAAWTVGMFKSLAEGGAAAVTFFETTGPAGIMESGNGGVFPVYHVLADLRDVAHGRILPTRIGDTPEIHPVLVRHGDGLRLLVANGTPDSRCVTLPCRIRHGRIRSLDPTTAAVAMNNPERFRSAGDSFDGDRLELGPYAIATLDFAEL